MEEQRESVGETRAAAKEPPSLVALCATFAQRRRELSMALTSMNVRRRLPRAGRPDYLAAVGLVLLVFGLEACKTYRVAPMDGGDAAINDSSVESSTVDATPDSPAVDTPVDAPIDVKVDSASSPDVGTVCRSGDAHLHRTVREQHRRRQLRHGVCRLSRPDGRFSDVRRNQLRRLVPDRLQAVRGPVHRAGRLRARGFVAPGPMIAPGRVSPTPAPTAAERRAPPARFPRTEPQPATGRPADSHVTPAITSVGRPVPAIRRSRRAARLASRAPHPSNGGTATCDGTSLRRDLSVRDEALRRRLHHRRRIVLGRLSERKPRLLGDVPARHQPQLLRNVVHAVLDTDERCSDLRRNQLRIYLQHRVSRVRQLMPGEQQPDDLRDHLHDPVHGASKRHGDL